MLRTNLSLSRSRPSKEPILILHHDISTASENREENTHMVVGQRLARLPKEDSACSPEYPKQAAPGGTSTTKTIKAPAVAIVEHSCPVCSIENEPIDLTCTVCSNVLQPNFVPNSWRCKSSTCKDSMFLNSGDVALCGVCGNKRCST